MFDLSEKTALVAGGAGRGIRVNAVAPGSFPAPAVVAAEPAFVDRLWRKVPLNRVDRPEELAGIVILLASNEALNITEQTIDVNGGWDVW